MAITVRVPTPLQRHTQGQAEVSAEGSTVGEVLEDLAKQFPGMRGSLRYDDGALKRFLIIYLNQEDIRSAKGEATPAREGDRITIVPAVAGGSQRPAAVS